ncbi:hypothetical protein LCGC14_2470130 [marine sediment metagenome]|uniref:Uncharacterized protein n=1 Tax=marine sediment metagenome TaxID=412755 RepID=A0A0F9DMQ5_9ZZZZ
MAKKVIWVNVAELNDGEIWDWCREMYGTIQAGSAAFRRYAAEHFSRDSEG